MSTQTFVATSRCHGRQRRWTVREIGAAGSIERLSGRACLRPKNRLADVLVGTRMAGSFALDLGARPDFVGGNVMWCRHCKALLTLRFRDHYGSLARASGCAQFGCQT